MKSKIEELEHAIKELSYEERSKLYTRNFGFGALASTKLSDKLVLISLISLTVNKLRVKNPELTTIDLLAKITGEKPNTHFYTALENLALMVDDLSYCVTEFDPCGLTNSKDIINKIKEFLQTWTPF
jgi:hypothetical protein